MANFDECRIAEDIIRDFVDSHPRKARKIGPVGVGRILCVDAAEDGPDFQVYVGITSRELPPKCAPVIERLISEAGLDVPIRYHQYDISC